MLFSTYRIHNIVEVMVTVFGFTESPDTGILRTFTSLNDDDEIVGVFMVPNTDSALLVQDMENIRKTSKVNWNIFERVHSRIRDSNNGTRVN